MLANRNGISIAKSETGQLPDTGGPPRRLMGIDHLDG